MGKNCMSSFLHNIIDTFSDGQMALVQILASVGKGVMA